MHDPGCVIVKNLRVIHADINRRVKKMPSVKILLSFKSRSQAPGWIIFGAKYIQAKFQAEAYRLWAKVNR